MEPREIPIKPGVELENQLDDKKILMLPYNLNRHRSPAKITEGGLSKADIIRGVTRNLMLDALAVLDEMRDDCEKTPELKKNYHKLYQYLDYVKRFCEGNIQG